MKLSPTHFTCRIEIGNEPAMACLEFGIHFELVPLKVSPRIEPDRFPVQIYCYSSISAWREILDGISIGQAYHICPEARIEHIYIASSPSESALQLFCSNTLFIPIIKSASEAAQHAKDTITGKVFTCSTRELHMILAGPKQIFGQCCSAASIRTPRRKGPSHRVPVMLESHHQLF